MLWSWRFLKVESYFLNNESCLRYTRGWGGSVPLLVLIAWSWILSAVFQEVAKSQYVGLVIRMWRRCVGQLDMRAKAVIN